MMAPHAFRSVKAMDSILAGERIDDLARFEASRERGFLPETDPARTLPAAFAAWESLAHDLPKRIGAGRVRVAIETLPAAPIADLADGPYLRRAMQLLSYLGHAYVWGETLPVARIPRSIAVPWHAVATRLGRPPVLSYASYALDNWRRIDPAGPIALGNIAILQNFLGGLDEDWFIAVHIDIEAKAANILRRIAPALDSAARDDAVQVARHLEAIAAALETLVATLRRMPEGCDPYIYFHRVRPYIHGWKNNPALPDGVVYEGVAEYGGKPQRFRGETGAQSAIVPALDAFLGVAHADDPLRAYLSEMRDYMPPAHRAFLAAIEAAPPLRPFVAHAGERHRALRQTYDACVGHIERFRTVHLEFAASYIHKQAQSDGANPNAVGTGGTPFMAYLRKHRDETAAHRIAGEAKS
jgi:indoleamine 2,3-dioxygenase